MNYKTKTGRGKWQVTVTDNEFFSNAQAVHRLDKLPQPKEHDPEKIALKRRLRDAMRTIERLNAERESGADMRAALAPLALKTFSQALADQSETRRRSCRVSDADLERLEEVISWLEILMPPERTLVLEWARRTSWADLATERQVSRWTVQRQFNRALSEILLTLRAKSFFSSCTKSQNMA